MDEDGYPEEHELQKIREWNWRDSTGLLEFVRERWMYADCGYWTQNGGKYYIPTAGWSGNEDLMRALQSNQGFWIICRKSSMHGGHYEFEVPAALRKGVDL